jgi:enediyne biosynthesis protein E4
MPRLLRTVVSCLFVAMLAATVMLDRRSASTAASPGTDAVARYGLRFENVAASAGIDFIHQAPTFDARFAHIMPMIAAMGAAVSVVDFDRDGWQDLYVTNSGEGSRNRLYRNRADGSFSDVAAEMGVADVNQPGTGVSMGAVWGDYDNDGFEDLFLYKYGRPELFHNEGGRGFRPVTAAARLPAWINANSALWLDYDRDGLLDLFVAGYWPESVNLWHHETTRVMPDSFEYADNGGRKFLLRNRGDGTFDDVTTAAGLESHRWTLAAVAGDLLGTGGPDLFLANDYGISQLFANRKGHYVEVSREAGVGRTPKSGMNAALGDVFNDGRLSIYQTNISEPGVLIQGNNLWVAPTPGSSAMEFQNLATAMGIDLGGWSWGAQFGDLNNDGYVDLYLTNGYVSGEDRASYWYDFSQIAVGHSAIIGDAANWPAMRGRTLSGFQPKRLWLNDGAGRFNDVAQAVGLRDTSDGRAVALADFSNTGVLDIVVANQRGPLHLYRNNVQSGRHWIAFELEGTASNRSAIGARVELHWEGHVQAQEVSGGSGFSAQNQRRLHYGLGMAPRVDRAVIRWPSGRTQTISSPAVDMLHRVREPA